MSGDGPEMGESLDSTVGSVRKKSWMDGIIDGIFNLFGKDKEAEREELRLRRLRANAEQMPVIAQRPVAPIKQSITQESTSNDNLTMTSMSDDGGIVSSTAQEAPPVQVQRKESIEDLAMLSRGTAPASQVIGMWGVAVPHAEPEIPLRNAIANRVVQHYLAEFNVRF